MFQKRLQFFRSLFYLNDLILVAICWVAAYYLRFGLPLVPITKGDPGLWLYVSIMWVPMMVYALTMPAMGVYQNPWAGVKKTVAPVLQATTLGVLFTITITWFLRPYVFSRLVFLQFYVLVTLAVLGSRPMLQYLWNRLRPHSAGGQGILIVGVEELGRQVAAKINNHPVLGMRVVGFLTRRAELVGQEVDGVPVLGLYDQIQSVLTRCPVQQVIIALPLQAHDRIREVLDYIADEMVDIKIVPDLYQYMSLRGSVEVFEGIPIIGLRSSPLEGWPRLAKRLLDMAGSLVGLVALSPLMAVLALAVKLTSEGPVFYRQVRMGMDGRRFTMYKFRSMRQNAEAQCGPRWACKDDPRTTRVGAFMRRTSLDELPQFFNVLRGDMSLVGPRPERPEFIKDFRRKVPGYMLRHKVKAGITGWAQVNGWRGNTSLERRIEHDLFYIENWSLLFDIKILFMTIWRGFVNPNAY